MNTGRAIALFAAGQISAVLLAACVVLAGPASIQMHLYIPGERQNIASAAGAAPPDNSTRAGSPQYPRLPALPSSFIQQGEAGKHSRNSPPGARMVSLLHDLRGSHAPNDIAGDEKASAEIAEPQQLESLYLEMLINRFIARNQARMARTSVSSRSTVADEDEASSRRGQSLLMEAFTLKNNFTVSELAENPGFLDPLVMSIESLQSLLSGFQGAGLQGRAGGRSDVALDSLIEALNLADKILDKIRDGFFGNADGGPAHFNRDGVLFRNRARALLFLMLMLIDGDHDAGDADEKHDAVQNPFWMAQQ